MKLPRLTPVLPTQNTSFRIVPALLSLLCLVNFAQADADDLYWNVTSGDWGTLGNWVDENDAPIGAFPVNTTGDYFLLNGTSDTAAEASIVNGPDNRNTGSVSIGQYNTLIFSGISPTGTATSIRNNGNFDNAGLITSGLSSTDHIVLQLNWNSALSPTINNTGTIQVSQGALQLNLGSGKITNAGGLLLAKSGALMNLTRITEGGTVRSETGGVIEVGGSFQATGTSNFTGVTIDNQGSFESVSSGTIVSGGRVVNATLDGATAFDNTGTTLVANTGTVASDSSTEHSARIDLAGTATFTNSGLLSIQNSTTRTSGAATFIQKAVFSINAAGVTFTNTGTIEVLHDSTLADTSATFTSVKSMENGGLVHIRGNANNVGADLTLTGGSTYSQTAPTARTVLERGGVINAEIIQIDGGDFGGVGFIKGLGTTIITDGGRLVAGDTRSAGVGAGALSFEGDLWFEANAATLFAIGADTNSSGRVVIEAGYNLEIGSGVILTLADLDGSATAGTTYRLFSLDGGSVTGSFVLNTLPTDWAGSLDIGADYVDFTLTSTGAPIPEPSTGALYAGLGVVMVTLVRRRRRTAI